MQGGIKPRIGIAATRTRHQLVDTTSLAQAHAASEITVVFTATERGCTVRFEHGGWTEANASDRAKPTPVVSALDRFAALANVARR